ncbi:MAG TPA: aminoacyl-histidine dipeptidase [Thermoanaerobaculia bacterium]
MTFVSDLDPQPLWKHFDEILKIPRGSKNEEAMRRYVLGVAERKGLGVKRDAKGNFVVSKPASAGREEAQITVLQSHLDMVNEKNADVTHDFERNPIAPRQDGEWVRATGTTLGADNGIGVAAMLAVLEADDLVHSPLELLFTVEEEIGLVGASALDGSIVTGRRLLNLDSEDAAVTIGCAGAGISSLALPLESASPPAGTSAFAVALTGLQGGHSGMEIHLPKGNALKLLARALFAASLERPLHVGTLSGGGKHNAIPREARAVVLARPEEAQAIREALEREAVAIRAEYPAEKDLSLTLQEEPAPERAWTEAAGRRALALIHALPHGVLAMSQDIPGLVETSTNVAAAASKNGHLEILTSSRSSVDSALRATRLRIRAAAELAGAKVEESHGYPGWKPDPNSPLLATFRQVHERLFGEKPEVAAVHAGLECGVIGEKCPGMQMISFGPRIEGAHSPDERVHVPSVARFWHLLKTLLEELASSS